jgi:hypothetical protein
MVYPATRGPRGPRGHFNETSQLWPGLSLGWIRHPTQRNPKAVLQSFSGYGRWDMVGHETE